MYRIHYLQDQVERQQTISDLESRLKQSHLQAPPAASFTPKVTLITQAKAARIGYLIQEALKSSGVEPVSNALPLLVDFQHLITTFLKFVSDWLNHHITTFAAKLLNN